jgi:glycosyltransferase involved in cell wall biosynthesis
MNNNITFSFIIPSYNAPEELFNCVKSIRKVDYKKKLYEIIIIDDGSDEKTHENLKKLSDSNTHIIYSSRQGAARARNLGIEKSKNDILVFLDQDVIVDPYILKIYKKVFDNNTVDIVQGNIWAQFYKSKLTDIHSKWRKSAFLDKVQTGEGCLKTLVTRNVALNKKYLEKFVRVGNSLLNEQMTTTGGEDRELGYRLSKFGARIMLEEKAIVYHKDPSNLWSIMVQKYRHGVGDTKLGIGERLYDLSNFRRVVINPIKVGVPIYFSFLAWCFHLAGCELEIIKMKAIRFRRYLSQKSSPRVF